MCSFASYLILIVEAKLSYLDGISLIPLSYINKNGLWLCVLLIF